MAQEKLSKALSSAISYLENTIEARNKADEKSELKIVWQAAADLEYALFLLTILNNELEDASWKAGFHFNKVEVTPALKYAKNLLQQSKDNSEAKDFLEAYKKAWVARGHLLKVQEIFNKKRRRGQ